MNEKHDQWDDFDALVTWATWRVIEGLTNGEPLRRLLFTVIDVARRAEFKPVKRQKEQGK